MSSHKETLRRSSFRIGKVQNPLTTISFPLFLQFVCKYGRKKQITHARSRIRSQRRGGNNSAGHQPLRSVADLGHPSPSKSTYRQAQHARSKICSNQGPAPKAATARNIKTGNHLFLAGFSYPTRQRTKPSRNSLRRRDSAARTHARRHCRAKEASPTSAFYTRRKQGTSS